MSFDYDFHKSQKVLHVGCEAPRAYFIPFDSDASAEKAGERRAASERFMSLCGDPSLALLMILPRRALTHRRSLKK